LTAVTARISRRRWAAVICLASVLAWNGNAATVPMPNPDEVSVADGVFKSRYFNLSYPLPPGWSESVAGPGASESGYYVLGTFVPPGELTGTILVAAQDIFFAATPLDDVVAMAEEFGRTMARVDGMQIDRPPAKVRVAGRRFGRIDFSGVGLFRSTLITRLRCHFLSFNLTAKSPEILSALIFSLNKLGAVDDKEVARNDPTCIGGYADADHLLTRIDPPAISPTFTPIPVRIVIGADGTVRHVHVIHATTAQRDGIETALGRWKFRPPILNGSTVEIETGLLLNFLPTGTVRYLLGNRIQ
jgi:hypothetical protein